MPDLHSDRLLAEQTAQKLQQLRSAPALVQLKELLKVGRRVNPQGSEKRAAAHRAIVHLWEILAIAPHGDMQLLWKDAITKTEAWRKDPAADVPVARAR